jgi:FkbM family methyltransferase
MKIFLDVGAHLGETVKAVSDPAYAFDRIECFEPVSQCCEAIERISNPRVHVHRFGLWDRACEHAIYDPGHLGASVFADTRRGSTSAVASFRRASDWFRENLSDIDEVYLKLNCEGAECDILDDLLASGEIRKVKATLVHFDVRKIPSQAHRETETRRHLREGNVANIRTADEVFRGTPTYFAGVQRWLDGTGARTHTRGAGDLPATLRFRVIPLLVRTCRLSLLLRALLPQRLYRRLVTWFKGYEV